MTCPDCGQPSNGGRCQECRLIDANETSHGVPEDHIPDGGSVDGSETLYRVNIKTPASPHEIASFCDLLETNGYEVVTDMQSGKLEIREGAD